MAQPALTLEGAGPERRPYGSATIPGDPSEADRWSGRAAVSTALAAVVFAGIVTTGNILLISRSAILAGAFTALVTAATAAAVMRQIRRYRLDAEERIAQAKAESARNARRLAVGVIGFPPPYAPILSPRAGRVIAGLAWQTAGRLRTLMA